MNGEQPEAQKQFEQLGLLTLHGCGDLSCSTLRLFAKSPSIRTVICVSCCFMKLKQRDLKFIDVCPGCGVRDDDATPTAKPIINGFPMSKTLRDIIRNTSLNRAQTNTTNTSLDPTQTTTTPTQTLGDNKRTCLGYLTGFLELATDTPRSFLNMTLDQLKER